MHSSGVSLYGRNCGYSQGFIYVPEVGLEPTQGCPHRIFESDKNCGMVRDAALRGAFTSLFEFLCGIVRVLVRPDCHQSSHHVASIKARDYGPEKVSEK